MVTTKINISLTFTYTPNYAYFLVGSLSPSLCILFSLSVFNYFEILSLSSFYSSHLHFIYLCFCFTPFLCFFLTYLHILRQTCNIQTSLSVCLFVWLSFSLTNWNTSVVVETVNLVPSALRHKSELWGRRG